MNEILKKVGLYGIVPVVKIDDAEKALPLAGALCRGGLPVAEITFRTACAEEAIKAICKEYPNMLVGAGTVLTPEQADRAVAAGAKFIVSPGLNPKVVSHCIEIGVPITPGCSNPSDIETALEFGLDVVKIFPAEAIGGLPMIKAMSAPYGSLKFMPTGGLNESNILSYLKFNKILACGGSYMVSSDLINAGDFAKIEEMTRNAVMQMHGFELSVSAACRSAFDSEHRSERRLAQRDDRLFSESVQRHAKTDSRCSLALARRSGIYRGDKYQPTVRLVFTFLYIFLRQLRLVFSV